MGIPLVALQGQSQPDPLRQAGEVMQLKALQGQIAAQPGQLQLQQQQIESQKRALNDQQARTAALQEWSSVPGSLPMSELPRLVLKHGGSADASLAMQQSILQQQTQLTTLDKDKLANAKAHTDAIGAAAQAVLGVSPENRPQAYALKMKELAAQGVISPQEAQTPYDEDMVKLHAATAMSAKDQIDTELKKRDTAAAELKAQTEAKREKFEEQGGMAPDKREMNDWLAKNPGKGPSDFLVWKAKNSPMFLQQALPAGANDPMVDMVGQNRIDYATAVQRMTPAAKAQFTKDLSAKYPNFNQAEFGVEKKVEQAFTSGPEAKNLTAFNTAIEHAQQLDEATKALMIGNNRTLNKIGNALGYEFGSDRTTNFNVIKNALSGEISKVFKGGQATDAEIKEVQGPFDAANSPAQLRGAIQNAVRLMNSKRDALKAQYEAGKQGKPNFGGETQHTPGGKATGLTEGQTGTGSDGKKYVVKGGVWVPQ